MINLDLGPLVASKGVVDLLDQAADAEGAYRLFLIFTVERSEWLSLDVKQLTLLGE
jgi:hypothetical protein